MPRPKIDFSKFDYQALSPGQRTAVVREVVRQARVDRAKEIAAMARAAWRGISRAALILGQAGAGVVVAVWRRYRDQRRRRTAAAQLYAMDDRALRDIGLRRGEIEFAVSGAFDPTRRPRAGNRARDPLETLRPKPGRPSPQRCTGLATAQGSRRPAAALSSSLP